MQFTDLSLQEHSRKAFLSGTVVYRGPRFVMNAIPMPKAWGRFTRPSLTSTRSDIGGSVGGGGDPHAEGMGQIYEALTHIHSLGLWRERGRLGRSPCRRHGADLQG